jgi:hypothetical protein
VESAADSMRTYPARRTENQLALKFFSKKSGSRCLTFDIQTASNELLNNVAAYRFLSAFVQLPRFNISNNASGQIQSKALLFEIYQGNRKLKFFLL